MTSKSLDKEAILVFSTRWASTDHHVRRKTHTHHATGTDATAMMFVAAIDDVTNGGETDGTSILFISNIRLLLQR